MTQRWKVRLIGKDDVNYRSAFDLSKKQYHLRYGADLSEPSAPFYFVYEQDNRVLACITCAPASMQAALFSEHYLVKSLDAYLPNKINRDCLIEIGSLASIGDPFATQQLIRGSGMLCLLQNDWSYALITVNHKVSYLLQEAGIHLIYLETAQEERLPIEKQGCWGTYYQMEPKVYLIDIKRSVANHLEPRYQKQTMELVIQGSRV